MNFVHIPKAAGISFITEMKPKHQDQDCYSHLRKEDAMNVVLFRSPHPHVQSQFLYCKFSFWGNEVIKNTGFPHDYSKWLDYFVHLGTGRVGPEVDFNCLDPRNVQARHMSCSGDHTANGWTEANHALRPPPDLNLSIANMRDADFVGISDFYHESVCVLKLRRTKVLPDGCSCEDTSPREVHEHHRHGVPIHKEAYTRDVLAKVKQLTLLDKPLFVAALVRFMADVEIAEAVSHTQILCNRTRAAQLIEQYSQ
jgi:hypothetical protein